MRNYLVIGKGFIFSRHKEAIEKNGGDVMMTVDIDPEKKADFLDYKEALASPSMANIDCIVICTPNHLHKEMVKASLASGKTVLCEKPLIIDEDFSGLENVNSVLQLRYHSLVDKIREKLANSINPVTKIKLVMKVYRDEKWWKSWRGDEDKSGGIVIGLAIHQLDFLIFLLGNEYKIKSANNSRNLCTGQIEFKNAIVDYHVEVMDTRDGQTRKFIINDEEFEMCDKDNLSFAGYHDIVHEELNKGNGIPVSEARKSIELALNIKKFKN